VYIMDGQATYGFHAKKEKTMEVNLSDLFIYDPDTGLLIHNPDRPRDTFLTDRGYNIWKTRCSGKACGSDRGNGYLRTTVNLLGVLRTLSVQRIALKLSGIEIPEGYHVDHIDGCRSNNKLENLRVVTPTENSRNRATPYNNTSGSVGVQWHKRVKKWAVRIGHKGRELSLGYFEDIEEAIRVRKEAEIEYGYHENHGREV
jgi:hypothetical protein